VRAGLVGEMIRPMEVSNPSVRVARLSRVSLCTVALLGSVAATLLGGIMPASAGATLVFERGFSSPTVWVARDDGSGARRLASGSMPRISPDGSTVAYTVTAPGKEYRPNLVVASVSGGAARTLASGWRNPYAFAWSPDSKRIATVVGPELGAQQLVVIEVATGATRTIASGYFYGVSFSPDGNTLVYGRAASESYPQRSDVYTASVAGGAPRAITSDHRSLSPLWGPGNRIVFVKLVEGSRRRYGPKNELYLMNPDGSGVKRLTHTKVGQLVQGLTPTQWSASGSRLLSEFGGQDTSYAVTVNPATGGQRALAGGPRGTFVGVGLSADGRTALGFTGGYEPGPRHNIVTIPYGGGREKVLVRNGLYPDWSG
jgi:Tol biopolymer transport system component